MHDLPLDLSFQLCMPHASMAAIGREPPRPQCCVVAETLQACRRNACLATTWDTIGIGQEMFRNADAQTRITFTVASAGNSPISLPPTLSLTFLHITTSFTSGFINGHIPFRTAESTGLYNLYMCLQYLHEGVWKNWKQCKLVSYRMKIVQTTKRFVSCTLVQKFGQLLPEQQRWSLWRHRIANLMSYHSFHPQAPQASSHQGFGPRIFDIAAQENSQHFVQITLRPAYKYVYQLVESFLRDPNLILNGRNGEEEGGSGRFGLMRQ